MDDQAAKIKLLNENPKLANKMKFYAREDGTWLLRVRTNQCHSFHSNDAIHFGVVKEQVDDLTMKIYVRMKNNRLKTIKPCENHSKKFRVKVKYDQNLSKIRPLTN